MMRHFGGFIAFMYALGAICTLAVVREGKSGQIYEHAWTELAFDVLAAAVVLWLLGKLWRHKQTDAPSPVALWLKRIVYAVAYAVAVVDVFCFVKFDSTLTPTMLLLVGETNSSEAGEFLSSFVNWEVLTSHVGWVLALMVVHIIWAVFQRKKLDKKRPGHTSHSKIMGWAEALLVVGIMAGCLSDCWSNKQAFWRLMSYDRIGDVEHELTETKTCAQLYLPLYRLAFSIRANQLAAVQTRHLVEGIGKVRVDSCRQSSPCIVLIIGESFNKHHAQLYGYDKPTTPRQSARAEKGELVAWSDVVAPWNLTSFVFKHLFSLYCVGDSGEWCDQPLFPELFRQAGYKVTFLTNQFLPQAREAVYDFSGGFFLNHQQLSNAMFDRRNDRLHYYDETLLADFDKMEASAKKDSSANLYIIHLKGQHVDYRTRYPRKQAHFMPADYDRKDLNARELQILAHYDNATLYNDSIVDQVLKRFEQRDAVVVYMPDHGEEVYGEGVHFYGRMHSTEITARLAREEFEIPFWCWGSDSYRQRHADLWQQLSEARDRRYMIDAVPHLLLRLAGIATPAYRPQLDVLSTQYDEHRPRILKNTTDYDRLMDEKK